jgi:hypothetical protein
MWFNAAMLVLVAIQGSPLPTATVGPTPDQSGRPSPGTEPDARVDTVGTSLQRIRRGLSRLESSRILATRGYQNPTFRVHIRATPFPITPIEGRFPPDWRPIQHGSIYHNEFLARVTRPEFMPYAVFTSDELPVVAATTIMTNLAFRAVKGTVRLVEKGVRARRVANTRREIRDALAAIESNRRTVLQELRPAAKRP